MTTTEDEFNQCPHEMVRATCPSCDCTCAACDRWRERDRMTTTPTDPPRDLEESNG